MKSVHKILLGVLVVFLLSIVYSHQIKDNSSGQTQKEAIVQLVDIEPKVSQEITYSIFESQSMGIRFEVPEVYEFGDQDVVTRFKAIEDPEFAFSYYNNFRTGKDNSLFTLRATNDGACYACDAGDQEFTDSLVGETFVNERGVRYSKEFVVYESDIWNGEYTDYRIKLHEDALSNVIQMRFFDNQDGRDFVFPELDIEHLLNSVEIFEPILLEENIKVIENHY